MFGPGYVQSWASHAGVDGSGVLLAAVPNENEATGAAGVTGAAEVDAASVDAEDVPAVVAADEEDPADFELPLHAETRSPAVKAAAPAVRVSAVMVRIHSAAAARARPETR
jgi:hypothetical protein